MRLTAPSPWRCAAAGSRFVFPKRGARTTARSGRRLNHAPLVGLAQARAELGLRLEDPMDHAERQIGVVLGDDGETRVVLELARERPVARRGAGLEQAK